jgi:hypothetical protein
VASLLLSRVTVPVLYFIGHQRRGTAAAGLPSPVRAAS